MVRRRPAAWAELQRRGSYSKHFRDAGFVDLYRRVNPSGPGLNYCFNRLASPTSRLQLLLGSENAADSVLDARVDIEYRRPIKVSCPLGSSQLSQST